MPAPFIAGGYAYREAMKPPSGVPPLRVRLWTPRYTHPPLYKNLSSSLFARQSFCMLLTYFFSFRLDRGINPPTRSMPQQQFSSSRRKLEEMWRGTGLGCRLCHGWTCSIVILVNESLIYYPYHSLAKLECSDSHTENDSKKD
ncbi:hypothetical protein FRC03_008820 [Tulasnella sp. 419]|nr:hypothetical protein FRC03_008820 [Tulasnella sp. 419]